MTLSDNVVIVIPARRASSRFPSKPLALIHGVPMVVRVAQRAKKVSNVDRIYVATDDDEIKTVCEDYGFDALMTSQDCPTGTDRVAEVASRIDADIFINVQGDEPMVSPAAIESVVTRMRLSTDNVVNCFSSFPQHRKSHISSPRVVVSEDRRLIYASRADIPASKEGPSKVLNRQVCIYGFNKDHLRFFREDYPSKSPLESLEDIEILRFLEAGWRIDMLEVPDDGIAVDFPWQVSEVESLVDETFWDCP